MNAHASRCRRGLPPRLLVPLALLLAALQPAPAARSQVADNAIQVSPADRLTLLRTGTFEVWRDTTLLGSEFYRVYATPRNDSLVATSTVRYDLRGRAGRTAYWKRALGIIRGLDAYPLLFQSREEIGGQRFAVNISFRQGNAIIAREAGGRGQVNVVEVPPGRLYILDPNVYENVENLVSDFCARGIASRTQNVIMTPRDSVQQVRLARGPLETVSVPGRGRIKATRVDLSDGVTLLKTWLDEQGLLLRLEAPAQNLRVVRQPPGPDEAEAAAQAAQGGEPPKGAPSPKGTAPPRPDPRP